VVPFSTDAQGRFPLLNERLSDIAIDAANGMTATMLFNRSITRSLNRKSYSPNRTAFFSAITTG
jgi:hypothetical protein